MLLSPERSILVVVRPPPPCTVKFSLFEQDHSREISSPQQVPPEPEGWKLHLQKPSSEAGRAAGKPLHRHHQVSVRPEP